MLHLYADEIKMGLKKEGCGQIMSFFWITSAARLQFSQF
jgi:hypothetical protein